jgi:hypothetical protein
MIEPRLNTRKAKAWILIPALLAGLAFTTFEAGQIHNSELLIGSITILALASWFVFVSLCVILVSRVLA